MAHNKHDHIEGKCLHANMAYCEKCDTAYCKDCDVEWVTDKPCPLMHYSYAITQQPWQQHWDTNVGPLPYTLTTTWTIPNMPNTPTIYCNHN
jgi:hypothetical protein